MEDLSIDVLLEFLYNRFAVTFLLCMVGSITREMFLPAKKKKLLNIKKIVTSTVFSTFLMCTFADYIDLTFSAYAVLSILCGIWGLIIVQIAVNENFVQKLLLTFAEKLPESIAKSATKAASDTICEYCDDKDDKSEDSDKKDSEDESEKKKED